MNVRNWERGYIVWYLEVLKLDFRYSVWFLCVFLHIKFWLTSDWTNWLEDRKKFSSFGISNFYTKNIQLNSNQEIKCLYTWSFRFGLAWQTNVATFDQLLDHVTSIAWYFLHKSRRLCNVHCLACGGIVSHFVVVYLAWDPVTWGWP